MWKKKIFVYHVKDYCQWNILNEFKISNFKQVSTRNLKLYQHYFFKLLFIKEKNYNN